MSAGDIVAIFIGGLSVIYLLWVISCDHRDRRLMRQGVQASFARMEAQNKVDNEKLRKSLVAEMHDSLHPDGQS